MGKVYTRFQTLIAQKPNTLGWHMLNSPPPRGAPLSISSQTNQYRLLSSLSVSSIIKLSNWIEKHIEATYNQKAATTMAGIPEVMQSFLQSLMR